MRETARTESTLDDVSSVETASSISSMSKITDPAEPASVDVREPKHHKNFYLEDEHIKLQADDTVYRVHSYFFTRESDEARALVRCSWVSADRLVVLDDVASKDLECFFEVLYCRSSEPPPVTTKAEWISVLHLSHMWNFASMHALAVQRLSTLTTPVDRVVLGKRYGAEHWLRPAYHDICEREEWLSESEGERLGLQDVLRIGHARQLVRGPGELKEPVKGRDELLDGVFGAYCMELPGASSLTPLAEVPISTPPNAGCHPPIEDPLQRGGVTDTTIDCDDHCPSDTDRADIPERPDAGAISERAPFCAPIAPAVHQSLETLLSALVTAAQALSIARTDVTYREDWARKAQQTSEHRKYTEKLVLAQEKLRAREFEYARAQVDVARLLVAGVEHHPPIERFKTFTAEVQKELRNLLSEIAQADRTRQSNVASAARTEQEAQRQRLHTERRLRMSHEIGTAGNKVAWIAAQRDSELATALAADERRAADDAEAAHALAHVKLAGLLSELAIAAIADQE